MRLFTDRNNRAGYFLAAGGGFGGVGAAVLICGGGARGSASTTLMVCPGGGMSLGEGVFPGFVSGFGRLMCGSSEGAANVGSGGGVLMCFGSGVLTFGAVGAVGGGSTTRSLMGPSTGFGSAGGSLMFGGSSRARLMVS